MRSQPESRSAIGEFDWWWLPAALRGVTLAQGLFIGVAGGAGLVRVMIPLTALAAVATVLEATGRTSRWTSIAEALIAGVIVGLGGPAAAVGLPYLVVPGFAAGLRFGLGLGIATATSSGTAFVVTSLLSDLVEPSAELLREVVQWGALGAALAALGAWGYRQRQGRQAEDIAYETASRLLEDLQDLAPFLTVGLDSASITDGILDEIQEVVGYRQAAILVPTAHGPHVVASRGASQAWLTELELSDLPKQPNQLMAVPGLPGTSSCRLTDAVSGWLAIQPEHDPTAESERRLVDTFRRQSRRLAAAQAFEVVRDSAAKEERRRIGREIHDGIAQDLASLAYEVENAASPSQRDQDLVVRLRELVRDLRLSVFEMREASLGDISLIDAVAEHAGRVAGAADLELRMTVRDSHTPIDPRIAYEITKIAGEALANVRRHAGARTLWVNLAHDGDRLRVAIADDGRGIGDRADPASSGLRIMQERADSIGAVLSVKSRPGGGTVIVVEHTPEASLQRRHNVGSAGR